MAPEGAPGRRAFLRSLAVGPLAGAGCVSRGAAPSVAVRTSALTDESVAVEVEGLEPRTSVVLRASAASRDGSTWASRARFEVGDDGRLPVSSRAPVEGTYGTADTMGPFWSKRPAGTAPGASLPPDALFVPGESGYEVALAADLGGETVATATTTRRLFDPDIERRAVEHPDLVGRFFAPPGGGPAPGVVHLHGAGGRPHLGTGRLLASRGFAALVLQYFGDPEPIPDGLVEVPVEYVERAVEWLRARDRVSGRVGLVGFSRGGSLALLAASRCEAVGAVVGWVPSGVVWEGLTRRRRPAGTSAWSVGGEPVPYLEMAEAEPGPPPSPALPYFEPALSDATDGELRTASVPVEEADAPIRLVSVTDDARWPSTALCERVVGRLDEHDYPHERRHDRYEGAGHYLRLPYLPTPGTTRDRYRVYGGDPAANARASAGAWLGTRSFLGRALGDRTTPTG